MKSGENFYNAISRYKLPMPKWWWRFIPNWLMVRMHGGLKNHPLVLGVTDSDEWSQNE